MDAGRFMHVLIRAFQKVVQASLYRVGLHLSYLSESDAALSRQQLLAHTGVLVLLGVGANIASGRSRCGAGGYLGRIWSFEPGLREFVACKRAAAGDPARQAERCTVGDRAGRSPCGSPRTRCIPVSCRCPRRAKPRCRSWHRSAQRWSAFGPWTRSLAACSGRSG